MTFRHNPLRLIWPKIYDAASAKSASRRGFVASVLYCLGMGVISIAAASQHAALALGSNGFVYAQIVIFAILSIFIWRMSRVAAIIALFLYLADEAIVALSVGTVQGGVIAGLFALLFVGGVRGTIAYQKVSAATMAHV